MTLLKKKEKNLRYWDLADCYFRQWEKIHSMPPYSPTGAYAGCGWEKGRGLFQMLGIAERWTHVGQRHGTVRARLSACWRYGLRHQFVASQPHVICPHVSSLSWCFSMHRTTKQQPMRLWKLDPANNETKKALMHCSCPLLLSAIARPSLSWLGWEHEHPNLASYVQLWLRSASDNSLLLISGTCREATESMNYEERWSL